NESFETEEGFSLWGPTYDELAESSVTRSRPKTPAERLDGWIFFNPGPLGFHPFSNLSFVPLSGPPLRFLRTPPQGSQYTTHVIGVIVNPKRLLNRLGDPRTGPQVRFKSRRLGSLQKALFQLSLFSFSQSSGPSWGRSCS